MICLSVYLWLQTLEEQLEALRIEVDQLKGRESQETAADFHSQILELQTQYVYA